MSCSGKGGEYLLKHKYSRRFNEYIFSDNEFGPRQIYRDLSDIISLHTKMFGVQPTACYLPSK